MIIAIKKEPSGAIYIDKNYFQRFNDLKFGFSKVEVPDEYMDNLQANDFDENLQFSIDLYNQRKNKQELTMLRNLRNDECFSIINRGKLWYDTLTEQQIVELNAWYKAWLDVTKTKEIPVKPSWLK